MSAINYDDDGRPYGPIPLPCIPDDGIVDWIAVELAAQGVRYVKLTPAEHALAEAITSGRHRAPVSALAGFTLIRLRCCGVLMLALIAMLAAIIGIFLY
jgi:hypothetical protein